MDLVLSITFGIAGIASVLMAITWVTAALDEEHNRDKQYLTTAIGLSIASTGILLLCINRTLIAMFDNNLAPWLLIIAALMIAVGKITLMFACVFSKKRIPFIVFAALSVLWIGICMAWFV